MKKKIISIVLFAIAILPVMSVQAISRVSCGNVTCIPKKIPDLTSMFFTIIQIAIPIILVVIGSIDLIKGMSAQKEDEMKKGQKMFIKRLIVAAVIFFIVVFVKLLVSLIADTSNETNNITSCIDCFISGDCREDSSCNNKNNNSGSTPAPGSSQSGDTSINSKPFTPGGGNGGGAGGGGGR